MFGFMRRAKAAAFAVRHIEPMFAGTARFHGAISPAAFNDAFVVGFLQPMVIHFVHQGFGLTFPDRDLPQVFGAVLNHLGPGAGSNILQKLLQAHDRNSQSFASYSAGHALALQHIETVLNGDIDAGSFQLFELNKFIQRNYMAKT